MRASEACGLRNCAPISRMGVRGRERAVLPREAVRGEVGTQRNPLDPTPNFLPRTALGLREAEKRSGRVLDFSKVCCEKQGWVKSGLRQKFPEKLKTMQTETVLSNSS